MSNITKLMTAFMIMLSLNASASIEDSLILHYPFDGDAQDLSGNDYHGYAINIGLTTDRNDAPDAAYNFPGSSGYITVPHKEKFSSLTDAFTIAIVAKPINIDIKRYKCLFAKLNGDTRELVIRLEENGTLGVHFDDGGLQFHTSDSIINRENRWQHIALTWDGLSMRTYIDGILKDKGDFSGLSPSFTAGNVFIGMLSNESENFQGKIDDVKMWNRTLSEEELLNESNKFLYDTAFEKGLLVHLPMTGNADDVSGNDFHGTVTDVALTNDANGNSNQAYDFSGSSGIITIEHEDIFSSMQDEFTISMQINPDVIGDDEYRCLLSKIHENTRELVIRFEKNGRLGAHFYSNGLRFHTSDSIVNTVGVWQHVVLWWNGTMMRTYVDGVLVDETNMTDDYPTFLGSPFRLGELTDDELYDGQMDDVKIYNQALEESEINDLGIVTNLYNQFNVSKTVAISPNPSRDVITLNIDDENTEYMNIKIIDMQGAVVMTEHATKELSINNLKAGIYMVVIETNGNIYGSKLIKE